MSAVVTDQFRIFNAGNFVDSVLDTNNSYYVFLGLTNPSNPVPGFGRTTTTSWPLAPIDNFQYESQYRSTASFGKKINSTNIRRIVRKVQWTNNTTYDMYRHDYSIDNPAPNSATSRLYDANYYVVNSDFNVYICIDNGSSGVEGSSTYKGNASKDEPTSTDLEPTVAGSGTDGYIWKFLFSISPSDIIKFDSTEYIVVPNDWATSTNSQIQNVREAADSEVNFNQIKKIYIEDAGDSYTADTQTVDILGDGVGGKVSVTTTGGKVTSAVVTAGGYGYTYGMIDLGPFQPTGTFTPAKLIPIIPPSRGHGYNIYKELGADRVLIYARFDDSTKDFPTDAKFSQVGIIKNPSTYSSKNTVFDSSQYSSLFAIKFDANAFTGSGSISIGTTITQTRADGDLAQGYVASYDKETGVLKYFQDRSLYFNQTNKSNQLDYVGVSTYSKVMPFEGSTQSINFAGGSPSPIQLQTTFSGVTTTVGAKQIDLGVSFNSGLANPEINKTTGDVIYIDNRKAVQRDSRQKEDIKIILEF